MSYWRCLLEELATPIIKQLPCAYIYSCQALLLDSNLFGGIGCAVTGAAVTTRLMALINGSIGKARRQPSDNFSLVPRQGTISIAGLTFTVIQDSETAPDCTFGISPTSMSCAGGGGAGGITVSAEERCAWQAVSNASWITVTSNGGGIGSGAVNYSVAPNPGTSGRASTITIAGKAFNIKQKGN